MSTYTLQRIRQTSSATFGELRAPDGKRICYTLERPFVDVDADGFGDRGVSRIPAGTYQVEQRWSEKHQCTLYGLIDVPGRDDIEIHAANDARELEGCIALGTEIGEVDTPRFGPGYGVRRSRDAMAVFEALVAGEPFTLRVLDISGGILA